MSLLTVRNLCLSIHGTPILHDVSFDVAAGEVFGLVGESGSGKSMTALATIRLAPEGAALSGMISLDRHDLLALTEPELCDLRGRTVGMIFQEPMTALNPVHRIGAQVAETLLVHGGVSRTEAWRLAGEKLARVGLPAARFPLSLYPHELSGGQRQRVAIAMAIARRPLLLIADEVTTALDVTTQAQILDLLKRLVAEQGMGLLLISHDLAVVAGSAHRVAVMQGGRIVETGPTEALFRARSHPYTSQLFAASTYAPRCRKAPTGAPLLCVEGARRDYLLPRPGAFAAHPWLRAVDDVSFTLHEGESLGLVGESGCGKSTLSRAILGLDRLQGGAVRLAGQEVRAGHRMARGLRAAMQAVFQDPYGSFNPRWRVADLVAEPFHLTARPTNWRSRVEAALEEVGLAATDAQKFIHEFSGGQRQRIAIARALIIRPRLIVLDEAVSALDVRVRAQILDLLAALQQAHGLAYLFISHDLSVVRAVTDRVMVMQAGRIVEDGATEAVFAAPREAYTRDLLAAVPVIPAHWMKGGDDARSSVV